MRTNILIQLLRFASTLLVTFEEWQKGTQQNTVVGENAIWTLKILRDYLVCPHFNPIMSCTLKP